MKKIAATVLLVISLTGLIGCTKQESISTKSQTIYEDAVYRGAFLDSGQMQVNVEFKLEKNKIKEIKFRHLQYKDIDYLKNKDDKTVEGIKGQYQQLIDYLIGKDVNEGLKDLYKPENIVKNKVDAYTGATLRSSKIVSAIRDGLNRGAYSYK